MSTSVSWPRKSSAGFLARVALKEVVKQRAAPVEWKPAKRRQKDVEARWTKKHGKSYFGYKLSVSVDRRHKLIRNVRVSDASEADTLHLVDVLDRGNSSRDFWADRGYHDKPRERWLKLNGWRPHIQRKGQSGKPIGERDKARNKRIASPRARVEHVFASLAQMGGKTIRSIGLARAQFGLTIKSAVYNLKGCRACWRWREGDNRPVSPACIAPVAIGADRIFFVPITSSRLVFGSEPGF